MNKVEAFFRKYKIKVIIYSSLLVAALIVAHFLLEESYNYAISIYEEDPSSIQVCENGINTLSRMKYYKNSKNYIVQMKRSMVEIYCNRHQFDEAKNYLDRNYQEELEDLYAVIEEEEQIAYMNSREGRTERVRKMEQTMGFGGVRNATEVPQVLISNIEYADLEDVGEVFPVWNRNDTYFNMVRNEISNMAVWGDGSYHDYYLDSVRVSEDYEITKEALEQRIEDKYNINIYVSAVELLEFTISKDTYRGKYGTSGYMIVYSSNDKWFFGGILSKYDSYGYWELKPNDLQYKGQITEDY